MKTGLMKLMRIVAALVLLVIVLALGGMFHTPEIGPGVNAAPAGIAAPDQTLSVVMRKQAVVYEAVGSVQSTESVDITARMPGQVIALTSDVGSTVKRGEQLLELEAAGVRAQVEQARSGLEAAQAQADQASSALARVQALVKREAATAQQLEAATAADRGAQAAVTASEQRLAEAQVTLGYALIVSPLDGIVAERHVDPGDMAWPGKPLLRIHNPNTLRVEFAVRESLIGSVQVGDRLTAHLTSLGLDLEAHVNEVLPAADPRTRTTLVRASLPTHEGLRPGLFARIQIPVDTRDALLIPAHAVTEVGQLQTLLVEQSGRWVRRYVTVGGASKDGVEILSGLAEGETIGWND